MEPRILSAETNDEDRCAELLAAAFANDPLMAQIWPELGERKRSLPLYFRTSLRSHHLAGGGVEIAVGQDGAATSVAVWDPPGHWQQPITSTLRAAPHLLQALGTRTLAALRIRRTLDHHHPRAPHWYLVNIGTRPALSGQGFAGALLDNRLAVCDETQMPAYLVCTREENLSLYEKYGFRVTEVFTLPASGPTMWSMWRDPAMPS
ncbi:GNAT family N-acetyltransferase [Rhodococcus opacus]|uniref:GNAT family N-acetyltransferase n=1 Tax=Rhodococcus opacus TaxID=37919 RepID=UPI00374F76E8